MSKRLSPVDSAKAFLEERFPGAEAAVLAGSVVMGKETATSDLDVVVIVNEGDVPRRESLTYGGWPVELFVHTHQTLRSFFEKDVRQRRPPMIRMWAQGSLLVDRDGIGSDLKSEAVTLLEAGYGTTTSQELRKLRYLVTDLLEDLEGDPQGPESSFVAPTLAIALCHLYLLSAGMWTGTGKWMLREAEQFNSEWTAEVVEALRRQALGDASPLIRLADSTLAELGGRLFDGYTETWTGE